MTARELLKQASERAQQNKQRLRPPGRALPTIDCMHGTVLLEGSCAKSTRVQCVQDPINPVTVTMGHCDDSCRYRTAPTTVTTGLDLPVEPGLLSVVIPIIDEDEKLVQKTLETIRTGTKGDVELIIVDDHSKVPLEYATIRNKSRQGATRSRMIGCQQAKGEHVAVLDSHMRIGSGNLRSLAALADATNGIAYCGCNRHIACGIKNVAGLPQSKWLKQGQTKGVRQTDGMMGACYVMRRATLEYLGGWVGLPGWLCHQELAQAINAWKHDVPIFCNTEIVNWHDFRCTPSAPVTPDRCLVNYAATLRFLFEDETWKFWREKLLTPPQGGSRARLPEALIQEVETPEMLAYGEKLRSNMTRSDAEFMEFYKKMERVPK